MDQREYFVGDYLTIQGLYFSFCHPCMCSVIR